MKILWNMTTLAFLILHTTSTLTRASCRKIFASPEELARAAEFVARQSILKTATPELKKIHRIVSELAVRADMLRELYLKCQCSSYTISSELAAWLKENRLLSSRGNLKPSWESPLWDKHGNSFPNQPPFTELILKVLHYVGSEAEDKDACEGEEIEPFNARNVYTCIAAEDILCKRRPLIKILRNALDQLATYFVDASSRATLHREYKLTERNTEVTLVELYKIVRIIDALEPRPIKAKRKAPQRSVSLPVDIGVVIDMLEAIEFGEKSKPSSLAILPIDAILSMEKSIEGNPYSLVIRPA
jgi:hypothetical protein